MPKLTPSPVIKPRRRASIFARARTNFLAGLVVIAPIGLTIWMIWSVVGWIDGFVLPFVPKSYHIDELINRWFGLQDTERLNINVRGLGVAVFLIFTIFVGWLAKGYLGRSFLRWGEGLVGRMPVVRSIYNGVKQIAETVFVKSEANFQQACLIEYPRKDIWVIGFVSSEAKGEVAAHCGDGPLSAIFVPTTPNPTSGFLLFVPTKDVIMLDMSIEDAGKLTISAGLVYPPEQDDEPDLFDDTPTP